MPRQVRALRGLLLVLALSLALVVGAGPAAAPVQASSEAGKDGRCTDASGVTVVVDFQELGGGIVVRCAGWPLPGDGTGLDALNAAGIPVDGVRRWGLGFICRIYDRPSATESVKVKNQEAYKEACIDTPPAAAYWSYWHSPNGGSWTYSQFGVKNRVVPEGSYEGWSFSLNKTAQTNPIPRVRPQHAYSGTRTTTPSARPSAPAAGGGSDDPLAPEPGSGLPGDPLATSKGTGDGSRDAAPSGGSSPTQRAQAPTSAPSSTSAPAETPTEGGSASAPSARSTSASSTTSSTSSTATASGTDREDLIVDSDELAARQADDETGSGPSWPLFGGIAIIVFLAVMAVGTALRRRSDP